MLFRSVEAAVAEQPEGGAPASYVSPVVDDDDDDSGGDASATYVSPVVDDSGKDDKPAVNKGKKRRRDNGDEGPSKK